MDRLGDILQSPAGRRILVVGLARSGISASRLLSGRGAVVTGTDRKTEIQGMAGLVEAGVRLELGGDRIDLVQQADALVLSPGVPLSSPLAREAAACGVPVIGELELAARLCDGPILAVTGTNGKSTTTALCAHLLERSGVRVFLGGNIGRPLSDMLLEDRPVDQLVVEVSSFQLEHLSSPERFVPHVAVWLNLTPDHIDRHGSLAEYADVKRRMFEGQGGGQTGIFFLDDEVVRRKTIGLRCDARGFSRHVDRPGPHDLRIDGRVLHHGPDVFTLENPRLAGDHNAENAAAAVLAAMAAGAQASCIQPALDDFAGLPHRLEPVRELDGVRWVDDSKGTNPDATAKSLTSFPGGIVLIAGGRGKGTDYRKLRGPVDTRVAHLVLMGEDAEELAADLAGCAPVHRVDDMRRAVELARRLAAPGGVVLLSPACASFDMFDDYAHRGRVFAQLVQALEGRS